MSPAQRAPTMLLLLAAAAAVALPATAQGAEGLVKRWVQARGGVLLLQDSAGDMPHAHVAGGARVGLGVLELGRFTGGFSVGYLISHASQGTKGLRLGTVYHVLDLRAELGLLAGGWQLYADCGPLLGLSQVHLEALGDEESALGLRTGVTYGLGLRAHHGRYLLGLEVSGLRRGHRNDWVGELTGGVGF